jgi:hypothetical protein
LNKEGQRVTFIPTRRPEEYGGRVARLQRDGGSSSSKTASKALYLHKKFFNELNLQALRFYPAEFFTQPSSPRAANSAHSSRP